MTAFKSSDHALKQPTVALTTVGCRLNQAETDAVQDLFVEQGYRVVGFDEAPDVHYINTCTVTGRADRSSRQWIHRARRLRDDSLIMVAGCFANRAADELAGEGEVDYVLGQREKLHPLEFLPDTLVRPSSARIHVSEADATTPAAVGTRVTGRSRAFLKVQDGCDHSCTYCAVKPARGGSVSAPVHEVREALRRVIDAGYEEVVFTGVDISDWRGDQPLNGHKQPDFVDLVELAAVVGLPRVRVSSLEPWSLDPDRIQRLAAIEPWCEHIHLALQSGDPKVLRKMNRELDLGQLRETMQELIRLRPNATIGADMIAGFPGETDASFRNTIDLLEEGWVHYFHVFPFSPRPGTPAAKMKNQVDRETVSERARRLRDISRKNKIKHTLDSVGRRDELLVERDGQTGYTRNYLRAYLKETSSRGAGKAVSARLIRFDESKGLLEAEELR